MTSSRVRVVVSNRKGYAWRDILKLRREQQLTLFELKDDSRPASQRMAASVSPRFSRSISLGASPSRVSIGFQIWL
jgi:hypothetical protein